MSISPAASVGEIKLTCLRGVLGPRTASMVLMLMDLLRADPPLHHPDFCSTSMSLGSSILER